MCTRSQKCVTENDWQQKHMEIHFLSRKKQEKMHPRGFDHLIVAVRLSIACAGPACRGWLCSCSRACRSWLCSCGPACWGWSSSCSPDIHTSLTVAGTHKGPLCCLISIDTYDTGLELNVFLMVPQL